MKLLMTLGMTVLMGLSTAAVAKPVLVMDKKAYLNVCDRRQVGCADSITVKNARYTISYDLAANGDRALSDLVNKVLENARFHSVAKSAPFYVEGYVAKEKGHFPNPTVEFTVFKITAMSGVKLYR